MLVLLHFNSIKVQLELSGSQASYYSQMSFQFHKGTIRTSWLEREDEKLDYFNSIKVQLELIEYGKVAAHVNYFNSIKVQLELTLMTENRKVMVNFNSIKVQLELI